MLVLGAWYTRSRSHLKTAWCARTRSGTLCLALVAMLQPALSARHGSRNVCCVRSQFSHERRCAIVLWSSLLRIACSCTLMSSVSSSDFCKTDCQHTNLANVHSFSVNDHDTCMFSIRIAVHCSIVNHILPTRDHWIQHITFTAETYAACS